MLRPQSCGRAAAAAWLKPGGVHLVGAPVRIVELQGGSSPLGELPPAWAGAVFQKTARSPLGLRGPGVLVELRLRGSLICVALGATGMQLKKGACCVNNIGKL